jgi:DNA repair protein RecO (recombination protein O)
MTRHRNVEAVILKMYPIGESHAGVSLITAEDGVLRAIAHGVRTAKGRLRGLVQPFAYGETTLYHDPVKNSVKITDFLVRRFHHGIREDLERYYHASLWSEIVLKSFGGGEGANDVFRLYRDCLDVLDTCSGARTRLLGIQFLHRYLEHTGQLPDPAHCGRCARSLADAIGWYSPGMSVYLCENCRRGGEHPVDRGATAYLSHTVSLPPAEAVAVSLSGSSLKGLQRALFAMAESAVEADLETLRTGHGILISETT